MLQGSQLIGVAPYGGANNAGSLFEVNVSTHAETTLYSFTGLLDGIGGTVSLIGSGNTLCGSSGSSELGTGLIFQVKTDGSGLTILHAFSGLDLNGFNADGAVPSGLALSGDGWALYGFTTYDGTAGNGTVFSVQTGSSDVSGGSPNVVVLHTFVRSSADGQQPAGAPALNGNLLYGVTQAGGTQAAGVVFSVQTNRSDVTGSSNVVLLHSFGTARGDGGDPASGVILSGTTLYGTTPYGGSGGSGTVYAVQPAGADGVHPNVSILHSFSGLSDGSSPQAPLVLVGGVLYGTTEYEGINGVSTFTFDTNSPNSIVTITATDTSNSAITGTSNSIFVPIGPLTSLRPRGAAQAYLGMPTQFALTPYDPNGIALFSGFNDSLQVTTSDSTAVLPINVNGTGETALFNITFNTLGAQTVTITDLTNPSVPPLVISVTVNSPPRLTLR